MITMTCLILWMLESMASAGSGRGEECECACAATLIAMAAARARADAAMTPRRSLIQSLHSPRIVGRPRGQPRDRLTARQTNRPRRRAGRGLAAFPAARPPGHKQIMPYQTLRQWPNGPGGPTGPGSAL